MPYAPIARASFKIVPILGAPESGKTHVLQAIIDDARCEGRRVRGIQPDEKYGLEGIPPDRLAWLADRYKRRDSDLLVFDDADGYLPKHPKEGSLWEDLFLRFRHWRVDVVVTARKPQTLSTTLLSAVEWVYLFRCSPGDQAGIKRLKEITGGMKLPKVPHQFILLNVYSREARHGFTLEEGGFAMVSDHDPAGDAPEGEGERIGEDGGEPGDDVSGSDHVHGSDSTGS